MTDQYYFTLLMLLVFIFCLLGNVFYKKIALKYNIIANLNSRTLHKIVVPRGGGIVFSLVFILLIFFLWMINILPDNLFFALSVGGAMAIAFGFLDDIYELAAKKKLLCQFILSSWLLFWLNGGPLASVDWIPHLIAIPITLFFLVWVINAYNFMDGIDGMAISGAVFFSLATIVVMLITDTSSIFLILSALLLACTSAFMIFNWPPASIFMGDTGSIFLGYYFGAQIIYTTINNEISIWTWIIIFGYFIADTTMTQIARLFLVKKWYKAHRSHAYQNIARITMSHTKVTTGVILYSLLWLLPISVWSVLEPNSEILASIIALTPAFIFAFKNGPVLSSS